MERSEAEAIYAAGREPVVSALVALSARLEAQDAQLEQRLKRDSSNSSLPPSHDPPRLQRRSLYAYLADALTAKARGDPVPSLMGA